MQFLNQKPGFLHQSVGCCDCCQAAFTASLRSDTPAVYCSPAEEPLSIFTQSLSEQISILTVSVAVGTVECAWTYCVVLTCFFRLYFCCIHTVTTFHHACLCQSANLFPLSNEGCVHANFKKFDLFRYLCMRRNRH